MVLDTWILCHAAAGGALSLAILCGHIATRRQAVEPPAPTPAATVIVPAYNAAAHLSCIAQTMTMAERLGIAALVVDDGSSDRSATLLADLCAQSGATVLTHARNRGKAAALNTGIAAAAPSLVATIDADTTIRPDHLATALGSFRATSVGVAAVEIRVAAGGWVACLQASEYRYVLEFERQGLARLGQVYTVPGAASVWRATALAAIGGFSDRTLAEDTDATIGLRAAGWAIAAASGACAVTVAPGTVPALLRQRARWIFGTLQACAWQLADLASGRARRPAPALCFGAICTVHLSGFLLPVATLAAALAGRLGQAGYGGLAGLALLGAGRIVLAVHLREKSFSGLPRHLGCAAAMHAINTAAFWFGLARLLPFRRRWR